MTTVICLSIGIVACLLLLFGPRISEGRAHRKQEDATDKAKADAFWDGLEDLHVVRLDDNPEAVAVDAHYAAVQQQRARRATRASDMPHGTTRRGTHL